jgi:serine phosphatase RsbU (regulator of sigma subunit)
MTQTPFRLGVPGVSVSARSVPAGLEGSAGGDFLDVLPVSSGRMALMLGDVAGHGPTAAVGMREVSSLLRSCAQEGHSPRQVVQRANSALMTHAEPPFVTCCYGDLDRDGVLRFVLAGHLPPLLLRADGPAEYLTSPPGLPLGVERGVDFVERRVRLAPGDALLLCTDGLVESRTTSVDAGLAALLSAAPVLSRHVPDRFVDQVLAAVRPRDSRDDVAVLVVRYDGQPGS